MTKIEIKLPDGRVIPCKIKDKHYKKLDLKFKNLSFWQKLKLLFKGGEN